MGEGLKLYGSKFHRNALSVTAYTGSDDPINAFHIMCILAQTFLKCKENFRLSGVAEHYFRHLRIDCLNLSAESGNVMKFIKLHILILLMLTVSLMLGSCGAEEPNAPLLLRQQMAGSNGCSFLAEICADYYGYTNSFVLQCQFDGSGEMAFEVLEPESICGITGKIRKDRGELTFDDQIIGFSYLCNDMLSPVSMPWLFVRALQGGVIESSGTWTQGTTINLRDTYDDESFLICCWLDQKHLPVSCEILWQGKRIVTMQLRGFQLLVT